MSTAGFIFLVIGLVLIYLTMWKFEWFRTKVNNIASEEICPTTPRIHKITLIVGCVLGAILAFTSSALKPYENLSYIILAILVVGTITCFTFMETNKRKGLLKGIYYVTTTFFLICASMFGVVMVIFLVMCYFIIKIFFGALLGSSIGTSKESGLINFLFGGNDSPVEPVEDNETVYEIKDENGNIRKLKQTFGSTHKDDLGDHWNKEWGDNFTRKED